MTEIIRELQNRGYEVNEVTTIKNGIEKHGLTVGTGTVRLTIYPEQFVGTVDEIVNEIVRVVENTPIPELDLDGLTDRNNILENVFVCVQRIGSEELVKRSTDYEGIEQYLRVICESFSDTCGTASMKVTKQLLDSWNIDESELWERAYENTFRDSEVKSMAEIMSKEFGLPVPEDEFPMVVVSNTQRCHGASQILNNALLKEIATNKGVSKLIVLPSSIHEIIVIPYNEQVDIDVFSGMVREVNATQVSPEEQLADTHYIREF